jgi:hypothetical protein
MTCQFNQQDYSIGSNLQVFPILKVFAIAKIFKMDNLEDLIQPTQANHLDGQNQLSEEKKTSLSY